MTDLYPHDSHAPASFFALPALSEMIMYIRSADVASDRPRGGCDRHPCVLYHILLLQPMPDTKKVSWPTQDRRYKDSISGLVEG